MIIVPEKWLKVPDANELGFLEARIVDGEIDFSIPVETNKVSYDEVTLNKEQDFNFILEGDLDVRIYKDEEDYYQQHHGAFAPESFIPSGLFSPDNNPDFKQTPTSIISGKIIDVCKDALAYGFGKDDYLFAMECLGCLFNVVIHANLLGISKKLEVGNYISGTFWINGWPTDKG